MALSYEFPWRLFRRWLIGQLFAAVPLFALLIWLFYDAHPSRQISAAVIITGVLTIALTSISTASYLIVPLGRLLTKARRTGNRRAGESDPADADYSVEQPEEWSDLDDELTRLQSAVRKRDERLMRELSKVETLMNALSVAVVAIDRDQRVLFFNRQFENIWGFCPVGEGQATLAEAIRAPDVLSAFARVIGTSRPETVQFSWMSGSGESRYYSVSIAPLRPTGPDAGRLETEAALAVFHDITHLKMAELIRVEFVANVSHELRTPLTSIKGYSDTLKYDVSTGQMDYAEKHLGVISRNVDRLLNLVNDLLDLSSLESGLELHRSTVDPKDVTERTLVPLEERARARGQRIRTRFEAGSLYADPKRVEQIITNLVDNAIKYVPEGSEIRVEWDEDQDGAVLLHVADNGQGIPREHLPRLFERFYRVDKARSREMGGTGLGLAIVKHILQAHGGTVTVRSEPGQGTEFICRFPRRRML